jgi:hypothetical protein
MLATTCRGHGVHHVGATRLLVVAVIVISHGCGLLMALLVPLFATLGARQCWAASLLTVYWVAPLCNSLMVLLTVLIDA